jgi:hypothetical protein
MVASGLAATTLPARLATLSGLPRLIAGLLAGLLCLITGLARLFSSLLIGFA